MSTLESNSTAAHNLVRLGMELGLAVNDYNAGLTESLEEINKITLAYLAAIKVAMKEGMITSKEIRNYFALVGQSWGSIQARFENEYVSELMNV